MMFAFTDDDRHSIAPNYQTLEFIADTNALISAQDAKLVREGRTLRKSLANLNTLWMQCNVDGENHCKIYAIIKESDLPPELKFSGAHDNHQCSGGKYVDYLRKNYCDGCSFSTD